MKKKFQVLWLALVAMLCVPVSMQANVTVTFRINYTLDDGATEHKLPMFFLNEKKVEFSGDDSFIGQAVGNSKIEFSYSGEAGSEVVLSSSFGYGVFYKITETLDADKTVDIQLYSLRYEANIDKGLYLYTYGINAFTSSYFAKLEIGTAYYLPAGSYWYSNETYGVSENYLTELFVLDKNTVIDHHYYTLTVNMNDTNGEVVPNFPVIAHGTTSATDGRTDENGVVTFQLRSGEYQVGVYVTGNKPYGPDSEKSITITDTDATVTLTITGNITFNINNYTDHINQKNYRFCDINKTKSEYRTVSVENGVAKVRLIPGTYYIDGYHGTAQVSDGCTITLGKLNVTCEGMGVAFPMENWEAVSSYDVIVGSPVRLTAIPVTDDKFQKWTINEKDYEVPVLDFKTSEPETTAKAVFGGMSSAVTRPMMANTTLNSDGRYIYLPAEVEGTARIYTLDGKLTKTIGVVGDQIGIYDLPTGAYVLTMESESGMVNARFLKK